MRASAGLKPGRDRTPLKRHAAHGASGSRASRTPCAGAIRRCAELRKSRAPISGLDRPSRASRAICRSCAVRSSRVSARALADLLAGREQLAAGALGERLHPDRRELFVGRPQLRARVDAATFAAQPLSVEQVRARELRAQARAPQPLDRFLVGALGVLPSLTRARDRAWIPSPQSLSAKLVSATSRCSASTARAIWPVLVAASISSGGAQVETYSSGMISSPVGRRPAPRRSGRGRCRGLRRATVRIAPRFPGPRPSAS